MKFRRYLEYGFVRFVQAICRLMPRRAALWFGRRLGDLAYSLDARHRKLVMANLDLAYREELSRKEKKRIARGSYRHFASMLVDFIRFKNLTREKIEKIADFEGLENLQEAFAQEKGVLILTGHFGFWELMGVAQGFYGIPLYVVARELDNRLLEKVVFNFRTMSGNEVLYKWNAIKAIMDVLKKKHATAVLIDQNVSAKHGIFVDFFGVPACTTSIISAIAVKTGAPVVPAFSLPLPGGRWKFIYEKPMEFTTEGNRMDAIQQITQQCTSKIEEYVRKQPEVWLWMHRRWKTRPPEENADGQQ